MIVAIIPIDGRCMRNWPTILLFLLAGLLAACGGADTQPEVSPMPEATAQPLDPAGDAAPEAEGEIVTRCTEVDPHPLGQSIAETFAVSYERVMGLFCSGHPFDEILMALQTSKMSDRSAEELFAMRAEQSWEQIWAELEIVRP